MVTPIISDVIHITQDMLGMHIDNYVDSEKMSQVAHFILVVNPGTAPLMLEYAAVDFAAGTAYELNGGYTSHILGSNEWNSAFGNHFSVPLHTSFSDSIFELEIFNPFNYHEFFNDILPVIGDLCLSILHSVYSKIESVLSFTFFENSEIGATDILAEKVGLVIAGGTLLIILDLMIEVEEKQGGVVI